MNLGYACINTELAKKKISVNRSCIQKTFETKGKQYAIELARSNLESVIQVLEWNELHKMKLYRLSSDMFPHVTNPKYCGNSFTYDLGLFAPELSRIKELSDRYGHRLTFHPGQFNQIGAQNPLVFESTRRDLKWQAMVLDVIGNKDSVLVVHGGGTYGDKEETTKRWIKQFWELEETIRNKIVIENCERQYGIEDVLHISKHIKRPVIFDTHHHECYDLLVEPQLHASFYMDEILKSWGDQKPKFHVSNQNPAKRVGAHSDYVTEIPDYLLDVKVPIDVMIEAKMKEQAVLRLLT